MGFGLYLAKQVMHGRTLGFCGTTCQPVIHWPLWEAPMSIPLLWTNSRLAFEATPGTTKVMDKVLVEGERLALEAFLLRNEDSK